MEMEELLQQIGRRIAEQRGHIRRVSQGKMAEELGMYQADISNMEHAKKGSGVSDLYKLNDIARYFDIPLESLIFGTGSGQQVLPYDREKMSIERVPEKTRFDPHHKKALAVFSGQPEEKVRAERFRCGPYRLYNMLEVQYSVQGDPSGRPVVFPLNRPHILVFYGTELAAMMTLSQANVRHFVYPPLFQKLQETVRGDVLDVSDPLRTFNPFIVLREFGQDAEQFTQLEEQIDQRSQALMRHMEQPVLLIESVYVREDFRRRGLCRLMLDLLAFQYGEHTAWLNMEPADRSELDGETDDYPAYTMAEVGQLHLNAMIAEKLGFTVDPDCWAREVETVTPEGTTEYRVLPVRKCAYRLSPQLRELTAEDGDLVEQGRAMQHLAQMEEESLGCTDLKTGTVDGRPAAELRTLQAGKVRYRFAVRRPDGSCRLGVSVRSVFSHPERSDFLEEYRCLEDAEQSEYREDFRLLLSQLGYMDAAGAGQS